MRTRLLALVAVVVCPLSGAADTVTVCPAGCDFTSVKSAVEAAQPADTVFIHPGTYSEDDTTTITTSLTIRGSGADQTDVRTAGADRVFRLMGPLGPGALVVFEDLTISHGYTQWGNGGGIDGHSTSYPATVEIRRCTIESNQAAYGGGISIEASEIDLVVDSSLIRGNSATNAGGGIWFDGNDLVIINSAILDNESVLGGGIIVFGGSLLTMVSSTVAANTDTSAGSGAGGIFGVGGHADISFSTIANNTTTSGFAMGLGFQGGGATVTASILSNPGGNNCDGLVSTGGFNIDDNDTCGFTGPGDLVGQSPGLGPFVDTGDHRSHFPLLPDSIALDHAAVDPYPEVDQRNIPRPLDGDGDGNPVCDTGSIELILVLFADGFESGTTSAWQ
jgi:hypothetical protein